jgi:hypothetical protein
MSLHAHRALRARVDEEIGAEYVCCILRFGQLLTNFSFVL